MTFASCKCKKELENQSQKIEEPKITNSEKMSKQPCPENGVCKVEMFKNTSLDIKTDEFGSIYYNKIESLDKSVILYTYNRNVEKGLQDGNYREEIVFEIDNTTKELTLKNQDLQQTKMLFGRFCYCKGSTGNYIVTDGKLHLTQNKNQIQFDLQFNNNKVPQIINNISESVKQ